jgi:predicted DNA-binding protein with PD1-like motif
MQYEKVQGGYFVRLEKGEGILPTVSAFAAQKRIGGGSLSGLGAVEKVVLGYFDRTKREYLQKKFTGIFELISLVGNVAYVDGEPFVHAHAVIADRKMVPHAGHLFAGTIAVTGEFYLAVAGKKFRRQRDPQTGLNLLAFSYPRT